MSDEEKAEQYMSSLHKQPENVRLKIYGELLDHYNKGGLRDLTASEIVAFMEESYEHRTRQGDIETAPEQLSSVVY